VSFVPFCDFSAFVLYFLSSPDRSHTLRVRGPPPLYFLVFFHCPVLPPQSCFLLSGYRVVCPKSSWFSAAKVLACSLLFFFVFSFSPSGAHFRFPRIRLGVTRINTQSLDKISIMVGIHVCFFFFFFFFSWYVPALGFSASGSFSPQVFLLFFCANRVFVRRPRAFVHSRDASLLFSCVTSGKLAACPLFFSLLVSFFYCLGDSLFVRRCFSFFVSFCRSYGLVPWVSPAIPAAASARPKYVSTCLRVLLFFESPYSHCLSIHWREIFPPLLLGVFVPNFTGRCPQVGPLENVTSRPCFSCLRGIEITTVFLRPAHSMKCDVSESRVAQFFFFGAVFVPVVYNCLGGG